MSHNRIMYLRDKNNHRIGCLAIRLNDSSGNDTCTVEYGLSMANPMDKFDSTVAKYMALGRLFQHPFTTSVRASSKMYDVSLAVMREIVRCSHPTRARAAAKLWISRNLNQEV